MDDNKMNELNKALEAMWESLSDEQKARAKQCRSMDELTALAGEIGVELPNEILDAVAGGIPLVGYVSNGYCPYCKGYHGMPDPDMVTITPKGQGGQLYVKAYKCSNKHKPFFYFEDEDLYFDDEFNPIKKNSGC
ncbi:MAG: hypothetical protein J5449_08875 [Oscillospiraceae bacterium]|nr:hypothetical protein [Oscillospiraceae bacterium]